MKVLIIIPAYNEGGTISSLIEELNEKYPKYDYVIINDGSTDCTQCICNEQKHCVLHLPMNLGIGGAVQTGYKYAYQNNYDVAVQIDGDGQHDISYIEKLIIKMQQGNLDVVIGSRFIEKEGFQSTGCRRLGINFISRLIWLCTGHLIYDVTSGFRLVNREMIQLYADDYPRDYPEPEAIVMALMSGASVAEVPVIMKERVAGTSSINLHKSFYYMIKVSLAVVLRKISIGMMGGKKL